jgi:hypothetical protein
MVIDAQLNADVYNTHNSGTGGLAGWSRKSLWGVNPAYSVEEGSNFAAQLYKGPDGTYKIAFRGTSDFFGIGDRTSNSAAAVGSWTGELGKGVEFVEAAINAIAREHRVSFSKAASLLTLTGHSQGGWEAQVLGQLFGLSVTSFDSPGGAEVVHTRGFAHALSVLQSKYRDYAGFNKSAPDSVARKYTALGAVGTDMPGTTVQTALLSLVPGFVRAKLGYGATMAGLHSIATIAKFEALRSQSPLLQQYSLNDFTIFAAASSVTSFLIASASQYNGGLPQSDQYSAVLEFMSSQKGAVIDMWRGPDHSVLVVSSTGDALMLRPDGSGTSVITSGVTRTQQTYGAGGLAESTEIAIDNRLYYRQNPYADMELVGIIYPSGSVQSNLETDFFVRQAGNIISSSGELQAIFESNPEAASSLQHLQRLLVNFDLAHQNRHDPFANTKIPDWVKNAFRIHTPNNPYGPSIQA